MIDNPYYNDLMGSLDHAWNLIEAGSKGRRNPFHTPVISTIGLDGTPQSRVLVLRTADKMSRSLRFNSDMRSPKVAEIQANPAASILMYDNEQKIQLRLSGRFEVHTSGEEIDAIWSASERYARRCYMTEGAPSSIANKPTSGLPAYVDGRKPEENELVAARANFGILLFQVDQIDWLYLATEGHRRARWIFDGTQWQGNWMYP
jgi:pyridoxamine 5'-phosphate oxidase